MRQKVVIFPTVIDECMQYVQPQYQKCINGRTSTIKSSRRHWHDPDMNDKPSGSVLGNFGRPNTRYYFLHIYIQKVSAATYSSGCVSDYIRNNLKLDSCFIIYRKGEVSGSSFVNGHELNKFTTNICLCIICHHRCAQLKSKRPPRRRVFLFEFVNQKKCISKAASLVTRVNEPSSLQQGLT